MNGRKMFVVAHCEKNKGGDTVNVYRSFPRLHFKSALKRAAEIQRNGYHVWIENRERTATR